MGFLLKLMHVTVTLNRITSAIGASIMVGAALYNLYKRRKNK